MAPTRNAVHIAVGRLRAVLQQGKKIEEFDHLNQAARGDARRAGLVGERAESGARKRRAVAEIKAA